MTGKEWVSFDEETLDNVLRKMPPNIQPLLVFGYSHQPMGMPAHTSEIVGCVLLGGRCYPHCYALGSFDYEESDSA